MKNRLICLCLSYTLPYSVKGVHGSYPMLPLPENLLWSHEHIFSFSSIWDDEWISSRSFPKNTFWWDCAILVGFFSVSSHWTLTPSEQPCPQEPQKEGMPSQKVRPCGKILQLSQLSMPVDSSSTWDDEEKMGLTSWNKGTSRKRRGTLPYCEK